MGKGIAYWHVVKSFFKSTTFKRHLNIYSNFTFYLFFFVCKPCVLFRWSLNVFSHTNQFRLTHSRLMPQNDRLKYWTKVHIFIDRSNSFNQNFYPKRKKNAFLSQRTKQQIITVPKLIMQFLLFACTLYCTSWNVVQMYYLEYGYPVLGEIQHGTSG